MHRGAKPCRKPISKSQIQKLKRERIVYRPSIYSHKKPGVRFTETDIFMSFMERILQLGMWNNHFMLCLQVTIMAKMSLSMAHNSSHTSALDKVGINQIINATLNDKLSYIYAAISTTSAK